MASRKKEIEIMRACSTGEEKKVQRWLKSASSDDIDALVKLDVTQRSDPSYTKLMTAVAYGREKLVKMLLVHKASVNMRNEDEATALQLVSLRGAKTQAYAKTSADEPPRFCSHATMPLCPCRRLPRAISTSSRC